MKTRNRVGLYLLSTMFLVPPVFSQEVKVSATLELPAITQGVPAVVTLRFQTENSTKIDLGEDRTQGIQFEIRGPSTETSLITITTPLPPGGGLRSFGSFQLDPKYPYEQMMVLAPNYFNLPGSYEIYVHIKKNGNPQFLFDQGNPLRLSVTPRDEETLRESCNQLAVKLKETPSAARRIELAHALASIHDPFALPFLVASVDRDWGVDSELIEGIEKIGNSDAVVALAQALKNNKPDISNGARAALVRISHNSHDQQIRNQAVSFLNQR
jgi:hypothetical protein